MRDAEWTLDYEGVSLAFGSPGSSIVLDGAPEVGPAEIVTDDASRPREDGIAFGQDFRGAASITFALAVVADDEAEARDIAASVKRAWRGDAVRRTPGGLASLTSRLGTRERVVFGRPRRFSQDDEHAPEGVILITADFQCVNDLAYSTTDSIQDVGLVPPPSGGMLSPLSAPLTTTAATEKPGLIVIGGDLPAWPVVDFVGPITNPVLKVTNVYEVALNMTIGSGQTIRVDSRPWARSIRRVSDGAGFPGVLTRSSRRLSGMGLEPGSYEVVLRGTDETGTASMRFSWRDTYSAI